MDANERTRRSDKRVPDDEQHTTTRRTFMGAAAAVSTLPLVDGDDLEDGDETTDSEIKHGRANSHTGIDSHLSASWNGGLSTVDCSHSVHYEGEEFVALVNLTIDVGEIELGTGIRTDDARELAEEILARVEQAEREASMNQRQLENGR